MCYVDDVRDLVNVTYQEMSKEDRESIFNEILEDIKEVREERDEDYCGSCNGSGEGRYDGSVCPSCKGSGMVKNK